MKDRDIRRALLAVPPPREADAARRAWPVVRAAFEQREPVRWPTRRLRPALALAAALVLLAAALTPPGRALVTEVREAIGTEKVGVRRAAPALFSLPAPGRLLVESRRGTWIVRSDGAKRRLGPYRDATWSPHGLFVAAIRGHQLVALDPNGEIRWSLARRAPAAPRWTGTRLDTRIAYLAGRQLRVVAGDSEDDRVLARNVAPVAPAWRPGAERSLAYVDRAGGLHVVAGDSGRELWRAGGANPKSGKLAWSGDGRRLLVVDGRRIRIFTAGGRLWTSIRLPRGLFVLDAAFRPASHHFAYAVVHPPSGKGRVFLYSGGSRQLFAGAGWFNDLAWSPNARWLVFSWREADQLVFLRAPGVRKIEAVSNVSSQVGRFSRLAGWCCAASP